MITKEKKGEILKILQDIIKKAKTIVFVNFHGLPVNEAVSLRKKLTSEKVGYKVAKKTLIKKVLEGMKIEGEMPELPGEIAMSFGNDLLAPARGVKMLKIVGGILEGKWKSKEEMTELAHIPERETLLGMFVNIINSPIQRLVVALDQISKKK